jgi:hypothetical protein
MGRTWNSRFDPVAQRHIRDPEILRDLPLALARDPRQLDRLPTKFRWVRRSGPRHFSPPGTVFRRKPSGVLETGGTPSIRVPSGCWALLPRLPPPRRSSSQRPAAASALREAQREADSRPQRWRRGGRWFPAAPSCNASVGGLHGVRSTRSVAVGGSPYGAAAVVWRQQRLSPVRASGRLE